MLFSCSLRLTLLSRKHVRPGWKSTFKTALKAANRDKSTRTDKHVQDKLLHRDLDKLVKEESKTNSKVL